MASYTTLKALFQSGEISVYYAGRTDSDIYATGVAQMENAIPHLLGGFRKRNGTHFFGSLHSSFIRPIELYTSYKSYAIQADASKFYVFDSDNPSTVLCECSHSYGTDIESIQYRANKGVLYIVHHKHAVQKLEITESGGVYTATLSTITFVSDSDPDRCITFSGTGNYPSAICFKGGRLFLGATDNHLITTYGSRTPSNGQDRYNDFTLYDTNWNYQRTSDTTVDPSKTYYAYVTERYVQTTDTTVDNTKIYYTKSGNAYSRVIPVGTEDPQALNWYECQYLTTGIYEQVTPGGSENPAAQTWYEYVSTVEVTNSHAIELEENDMYGTKILWYVVQNRLICGNNRSIFMDTGAAATPEGFDLSVVLNTGTTPVQAKVFKNYVCLVGQTGKSLHIMVWDEDSEGYVTIDMSKNSPHLLRAGIKDFDIVVDPIPTAWIVTNSGELLSCAYDTSTGLAAWSKHPRTCGKYVGITVAGENHNRIFLTVKDGEYYHGEYLDITDHETIDDAFYVDCGEIIENATAQTTFTLNSALEGHDVVALGDNGVMPVKTVENNKVTYDTPVKKLVVGLPIITKVHTFSPEIPANGTSQGKFRNIKNILVRLYESYGGKLGQTVEAAEPILLRRYGAYSYGDPITLVSEDIDIDINSKNTRDGSVYIIHEEPVPFNLLSLITKYEVREA